MSWIVKVLLPIVLPFVLGQLTTWLMAGLKWISATIGTLNPTVQQIIVGAIGFSLAALAKLVGATLPCDPTAVGCDPMSWPAAAWTGILSTVIAFVLHNSAKISSAPPPA